MDWHKMFIQKRISEVYSNYTIQQFWEWWGNKQHKVMEIRITDFELIKSVALKYELPFSISGIFVKNYVELKQVIREVRDRATMWMGANSRKRNFNRYGKKVFGGLDSNVEAIEYLFIDVDRIVKNGEATNEELGKCDELANRILKKLDEVGWANNYAKICTGNGVQLLIKLDYPIVLPQVEYKKIEAGLTFPVPNEEFERIKKVIKNGIGQQIIKFSNRYKEELGVEVDKSCFNIGRVCALPWTKNYKFGGFTWRGLVSLKEGLNVGLADYILSRYDNENVYNKHQIFTRTKRVDRRLKPEKLRENELVQFMLNNEFPKGYVNNTIWMQLKCLLRDSKIDLNSTEWRLIHEELKVKHKRTFTLNMPEQQYEFSEDIINHYCIENNIPPLYLLWRNSRTLINDNMKLNDLCWQHLQRVREGKKVLPKDTTIWEDMEDCKKELKEGEYNNIDKVIFFVRGIIDKYGEDRAKYLVEYVLKDYFQRSSK